ncbi:hypothetical protein [Runella sp.]|uniref:hypothetical protein n=1 Tax=Runella sp. TaxID=1960881 RepID=UPI00301A5CFD
MEELIKAILIQLFILSLISERITNFIKLNLQTLIERYGSKSLSDRLGNLRNRESTEDKEKQRERGILNWAIVVSILMANAVSADLFYLMTDGKLQPQWEFSSMLGYCLTGLFISLGSKFWHDLLDIVLYTSNLKRKLADTTQFQQIDRIEQVDEFVNLFPSQVAQMALVQWKEQISSDELSNVMRVNSAVRRIDGQLKPCLYVYLKDERIPQNFNFNVLTKAGLNQPVHIIWIPRSAFPKPHLKSGDSVKLRSSLANGTLCCFLKKPNGKSVFALTCRHVFNPIPSNIQRFLENPKPVTSNGSKIGEWTYEQMDEQFDMALVKMNETSTIDPVPPFSKSVHQTFSDSDIRNMNVNVITKNGFKTGKLIAIHRNTSIPFDYNGDIHDFVGLLEFSQTDATESGRTITERGDSGSMVFDSDTKKPIGMIIGGNETSSFAIPLVDILEQLKTEIFFSPQINA